MPIISVIDHTARERFWRLKETTLPIAMEKFGNAADRSRPSLDHSVPRVRAL